MTRRRVVCVCSRESEVMGDADRRKFGWRLVPGTGPEGLHTGTVYEPPGEVFVWVCPPCAALRNAQLAAS